MKPDEAKVVERFRDCTSCFACLRHCPSYQGFDKGFVKELAQTLESGRISIDDALVAYRCTLCGFCGTQCPYDLSVRDLMDSVRYNYVKSGQGPLAAHTPLYVNRKVNFFSLLDGSSHKKKEYPAHADRIFFPGCSLRGYRPGLVGEVAHLLGDPYVMGDECCGKPLKAIGDWDEYEKHNGRILGLLESLGPSEIILSCPNCYGTFKPVVKFAKVIFAAEALLESLPSGQEQRREDLGTVVVHDSCPFRESPELFDISRKFVDIFYGGKRVEMKFSRERLQCCGGGGAVSYANEKLSQETAKMRLQDAKDSGADTVITFCNSCGVQFGPTSAEVGVKVRHAFDILFPESPPDYAALYKKSRSVFSGVCLLENLVRLSAQI